MLEKNRFAVNGGEGGTQKSILTTLFRIESLNTALDKYKGTLIFVSHDREFVSSLATRILDIQPDRIVDYSGNYEDYLASQGVA